MTSSVRYSLLVPVRRNSLETRKRILKAVGRLLARSGFRDVGINSVAHEAGVDKVLIYRYFGGLPELLRVYAEEGEFWPSTDELLAEAQKLGAKTEPEMAAALLIAFGRSLRRRPITQEIMRWELLERNVLTDTLAHYREDETRRLLSSFSGKGIDVEALTALIAAGQTYLTLRAKTIEVYSGIKLRKDNDWKRIEVAISLLLKLVWERKEAAK